MWRLSDVSSCTNYHLQSRKRRPFKPSLPLERQPRILCKRLLCRTNLSNRSTLARCIHWFNQVSAAMSSYPRLVRWFFFPWRARLARFAFLPPAAPQAHMQHSPSDFVYHCVSHPCANGPMLSLLTEIFGYYVLVSRESFGSEFLDV